MDARNPHFRSLSPTSLSLNSGTTAAGSPPPVANSGNGPRSRGGSLQPGSPASPAGLSPTPWAGEVGPGPAESGSPHAPRTVRGRGSAENPASRFETLQYEADSEALEHDWLCTTDAERRASGPKTQYLRDPSRTIISTNQSPDIGFEASINPYRGCEHGCSYCYARPTHEYLGFSAGLDFETRILVKDRAPELLRSALRAKRWKPQVIAISGVTDAYQPIERHLKITRRCLSVLEEFRNPVTIVTKNALVARDADILSRLAEVGAASVNVSVTTLDASLQRAMEPRASHPEHRLRAIERLASAGVPVGVMVGPVVPGLTDHEIPAILDAAATAGARFAGHIVLRLPHGVKELFTAWLERHRPERAKRVLARVRDVRGGKLYDSRFGSRLRGEGLYAAQISELFHLARRRSGLSSERLELSTDAFRADGAAHADQLGLFGAADSPTA